MTKKKSKISNLSQEEIAEAQRRLDELCAVNNITSWNIQTGSGKAKWKSLVLALCGIPIDLPKKVGRHSADATNDNHIFQQIIIDQFFSPTKKLLKSAIYNAQKKLGFSNGQIRAARNRAIKQKSKELDELAQNYDPNFPCS